MTDNTLFYGKVYNAICKKSMRRGKTFTIMMLLLVLTMGAKANPVDMRQAREVGAKFVNGSTSMRTTVNDLRHVTTYKTDSNAAAFYVFNMANGFVIVAADDCSIPILAYSKEGPFDVNNIPEQMEGYLQVYRKEIQYGIEHRLSGDESIAQQWDMVRSTGRLYETRSTTAVEPMLSETWNQNCYYNALCPEDPNGPCGHVYAGCVATAMGQLMHFWQYPTVGSGTHTYTPEGYPEQTADFGATTYDWANMPDNLDSLSSSTQIDAVATLLWHCGIAVNMVYSPVASGAYSEDVPYALTEYFNYSDGLFGQYKDNNNTYWLSLIKSNLELGMPIYYTGSDLNGSGGHAFICDGYDANDYLHFNWGWSGNGNDAYFAIDALNVGDYQLNLYNYAIFNIRPQTGNTCQITAVANLDEGGTVNGGGTYYEGSLCTLTALSDYDYSFVNWTKDGVVVSTDPTYSFMVTEDATYVANFELFEGIPVGSGTATNVYLPNYSYYCYTLSQQIYTSEDIDMAGTIISLAFYNAGETKTQVYDIYMVNTEKTYFENYYDWITPTAEDLVFSGTVTMTSGVWTTIVFDNPFVYDGTNFALIIDDNTGSWTSSPHMACRVFATESMQAMHVYGNGPNYDPLNPMQYEASALYYEKNQIRITMEPEMASTPMVNPDPIDLGYRPNGAWMLPYTLNLYNPGYYTTINSISSTDPYFQLDTEELTFPFNLGYHGNREIKVDWNTGDGQINGLLNINYGDNDSVQFNMTAHAYTPVSPDVWEMAEMVTSFPYTANLNSTTIPLYNNYRLPPTGILDGADAVYKLVFTEDTYLNASVTSGEDGKVALYPEDFHDVGGPDFYNNYTAPEIAIDDWLHYDDGNYVTSVGASGDQFWWGIKLDMEAYAGTKLTKISVYDFADMEGEIMIYQTEGTPSGEPIQRQNISLTGSSEFVELTLDTPYNVDATMPLWIVIHYISGFSYPAAVSNDSGDPNGRWISLNNSDWNDLANYGFYYTWMLRGFVTNQEGRTMAVADGNCENMTVTPGTYYLVASSTSDEWSIEINAGELPCPDPAYSPYPVNYSEVNPNRTIELSWQFGQRTTEYKLMFGTTESCEQTLVDWTRDLVRHYTLPDLIEDTTYYWKIVERNDGCSEGVESPVWSFITRLNPPQNLYAETNYIMEGESAMLYWSAPARALLSYNVYQDGVLIGNTTDTYYVVDSLGYNMDAYAFYVTGVFDAGESAPSNYAYIYVSGNGFVAGYVYEQDGSTGIENATVTFTGYDEFGYFNTFAFTTDDNGYYEGSLRAGSYQATASCTGYQSKLYEDSVLIVYNNLTEDIEIIMNELFNPVAEVVAEYYPDANDPNSQYIKVMWGNEVTENNRSLQYYRVYRTDAYYDGPYTIENTEVLSNQLYDTLFIDTSWLEADPGVYKWGVGCVYMGNRGEEIESPINWAAPLTIDNNSHVYEGTIIPAPQHGQANHLGTATIAIYMPNRGNATIGDAEKTNSDEPNSEFENLQEPRESEIVWSNFLSKDMDLINGEMNITVSLNSGDSPVGTMVTFTNLNSIEQQLYPITDIILDSTGYYAWDTFRKGDYQMTLTKEGYATITEYVSIWDTTSLSYELEEITQSPTRLYVSSTGWAKWDGLGNDLEMGDRHYEYNQVVLTDMEDNVLYTENTTNKYCQLLVDSLVEGNTYHCKVASVYSSGITEWVETDWMYQACDNYEGVSGLIATTTEEGNLISWTYPEVSSRATRGSVAYACNVDSTNWVSYNLDNPLNATTLNNISLYGGDYCGFDGYVYATYYGNSYKIEPQTGTVVEQKPIDINYGFYDCAWDYTTHTMYGSVDQELYIWNIESNELQYIGNMGVSIEVLVCNLSGELYGIAVGSPANLYKINKANASVELVGSTGQNCSYYYQSGAIDHHTGKFYWAGYNGNSFLAEVNMVTGLATVLTTGIGHQTAFNVPFNGSLFVLGAMVYRDNELISFTSDNSFLDEGDMDSHQYDIRVVYTGSAICPDNNTYYSMSCLQTAIMGETFEITAMTSPEGAGIIEGAGIYISGASCTLTVTPNEGYTFINWTKNDEVVSTDATYSFTVTENAAYVANFSLDSYEITATTSPEGAGIIEGAGTYTHGASCTLTVTPNEGYTFINWTKNDEVVSTDTTYSFTVTEDAAYVANFIEESVSYSITVTANPPEGGTVTGAGNYEEGQLCTLTATANENYTFVNWTKDGVEVSTDTTYSFTVTEDAAFIANFTLNQGEITQISNFSEGYNWWSTYIEQEDIEGLGMLQEGLGDNGVTIRSQASGYTDNYAGYGWYCSLSSINNESSYRVITNAPCTVTMTGDAAVPSQHPITLGQGWTWIGYVPSTTMSVDPAMVSVDAVQGDRLKSQQGYADFYPGYGWYGSLNTMEPGMGLMYYSTSSNPVSFTYPDSDRGGELKKNLTSEYNHWKPNIYAYPDNMTVMAVVELDGKELSNENYELAAFAANGECRGSVKLIYAEPINRHVAFLTISGKDAAELSFRLYDTETGTEYYDVEESLGFVANAIVGEADDLYTIHFRSTTGMDEFASKVRIYPNPVNKGERFSIGMNTDVKSPVSVEIINALGTVVSVETSTQAPASIVAPVTAGVYTLRISCKEGTCYRKMVVR